MFKEKFGIEIEFTGMTRNKASKVVAEVTNGTIIETRDYYDTKEIKALDGRKWKVMYDGSLRCQTKRNGEVISAGRDYSCELVSPILTYDEDIEKLQEIVRALRKSGAFTNASCGIHIHLDGADHDVRTIRNFINIIASKNDLLYKALEIKQERMRFCKKMDEHLVTNINKKHPPTSGTKATTEVETHIITIVDITSLTCIHSLLETIQLSLEDLTPNFMLGR